MKLAGSISLSVASTALLLLTESAIAYEVSSHAAMSLKAFDRSQIGNFSSVTSVIARLGLVELHNLREAQPPARDKNVFGDRYYDLGNSGLTDRYANSPNFSPRNYERTRFTDIGMGGHLLTIPGWVARGAIREDDFPTAEIPQDGQCSLLTCYRILNHFFDPYHDRAFNIPLYDVAVKKSPDWAIGAVNAFAGTIAPDSARDNRYSVFDARDFMYRALTLRKRSDSNGGLEDITEATWTDADREAAQRRYWASTFRALGNVIHHLQDMAQPQHTRGDPHAGDKYEGGIAPFGHASFYEKYVDARIKNARFKMPDDTLVEVAPLALSSMNYAAPKFNSYSDYWSTARGAAPRTGSLTGNGLADYSSRGFYTAGTNIGSGADYPDPPQSGLADVEVVTEATDMTSAPVSGSIEIFRGTVRDTVSNTTATQVRLSSYSIFDQFLRQKNAPATYNLNKYNLDAMAELLIPRAIAYSTGLIDYFFRGKLKISLPTEKIYSAADYSGNAGFTKLGLLIQNITDAITPPSEVPVTFAQTTDPATGTLVAVLRYRTNVCLEFPSLKRSPQYDPADPAHPIWDEANCRKPSMRGPNGQGLPNITVSETVSLPAGGIDAAPTPVVFHFAKPLPFNATDVDLMVVYRGGLGAETDGIAVGFEQLSEPTFYDFHNLADCSAGYDPSEDNSRSANVDLPFSEAGPVDAQVVNLPAGRFGRVGFITRATLKKQESIGGVARDVFVVNNQDFGADQIIFDESSGNVVETWPAGLKQTAPLMEFRRLPSGEKMLSWRANVHDVTECTDYDCFATLPASCPALSDATPFPVEVKFLQGL